MSRLFKTVDYEATLDTSVRLGDCLPPDHLARFVADVVSQLELAPLYTRYGSRGGAPYAPEILLGLLFYAYATGVFASRKIERATRETAAFRFLAGNYSPDHDTISVFRKQFLPELKDLFVQILLLARETGVLEMGNLHIDGTKIHADASKSKAVSYKRLSEIELHLRAEVAELFALAEQADGAVPEGMNLPQEIARREDRLQRLAEAKAVLEARAAERHSAELAEHEAKVRERAQNQERTGKKPRGRPPQPPTPGPKDGDQYNFTDPDSRIMKNSRDDGFGQHYNGQVAVEEGSRLIVGFSLSNHANDQREVEPTLASVPEELGPIRAAALDTGFFSRANINAFAARGIQAYIATGRDPHNRGWRAYFAGAGDPPPAEAGAREKMAYKLRTAIGKAIYRRRKCTVEPVIGIVKDTMGFRQFSLRGLDNVAGEWRLVCLAYNLRRLHVLTAARCVSGAS
jgi:transposase